MRLLATPWNSRTMPDGHSIGAVSMMVALPRQMRQNQELTRFRRFFGILQLVAKSHSKKTGKLNNEETKERSFGLELTVWRLGLNFVPLLLNPSLRL